MNWRYYTAEINEVRNLICVGAYALFKWQQIIFEVVECKECSVRCIATFLNCKYPAIQKSIH
jgi:hypothetical protein